MLSLRATSKTYTAKNGQPVHALAPFDMVISEGEFVTVVGPSGSGKSTLLYLMGAMLQPSSGQVLLDDVDLYASSQAARSRIRGERIGFLFQSFNLVPYLTCQENVVLPANLAGRARRQSVVRAGDLLRRLGLGNRANHLPAELSVGERQRAALCRGLINDPDVLLVDEPTGNLDDTMAAEVRAILTELNSDGQTIVTVTHDQRLAGAGNRRIELKAGSIISDELEEGMISA